MFRYYSMKIFFFCIFILPIFTLTESASNPPKCKWQKIRVGINAKVADSQSWKSRAVNLDRCEALCMMIDGLFKDVSCGAYAFSYNISSRGSKHNCYMYSSEIDEFSFNTTGLFNLYKQNCTDEIKDKNCCDPITHSMTSSPLINDDLISISYDSNVCRKTANITCTNLNIKNEMSTAIVINNNSNIQSNSHSYPATCNNGKWQMSNPPLMLTIESLECQLTNSTKKPEQNGTGDNSDEKNESCCDEFVPSGHLASYSYDSNICRKGAIIICSDQPPLGLTQLSYKLALVDKKGNYINSDNRNLSTSFPTFATCKNQKWHIGDSALTGESLECRLMQIPMDNNNSVNDWEDGSCCGPLFQRTSSNSSLNDGLMTFLYDSNQCRKTATIKCSPDNEQSEIDFVVNKQEYGFRSFDVIFASAVCINGKWQTYNPRLKIESLECQAFNHPKQPVTDLEDKTCCDVLAQSVNPNSIHYDKTMSFSYLYDSHGCRQKAIITCSNAGMPYNGTTAIGVNKIQYDTLITEKEILTVPAICKGGKWQIVDLKIPVESLQCQFIPSEGVPIIDGNNHSTNDRNECCGPLVQSLHQSPFSSDGTMSFSYDSNACRTTANITCSDVEYSTQKVKSVIIVNKIQYIDLGSELKCNNGIWQTTDPQLLNIDSIKCQYRPVEKSFNLPEDALKTDESCCDPLFQNVSLNKILPDGTMTFLYDSNDCRKKVNATCSYSNLQQQLQTNFIINERYTVGYGTDSISFPLTCKNKKWATPWEELTVETSLECLLSYI